VANIDPPQRLLCGPGPSNVAPSVLSAMGRPLLGHMDPELFPILTEIVEMLGAVWRRENGLSIPLQATGTAGMEAGIDALVEPGDTVIVGVAGFFGARIAEIARRHGAQVVEVTVPFGEAVPVERLLDALERHAAARLVCIVHAETSTGLHQPLEELAPALAERDTLLMLDCVTALGGVPVEADAWAVDYAYSCSQKCLGAPPGLAPVSLSERALERIRARSAPTGFTFDFELLGRYWAERPATYHHTAPVLHLYALHEALRLALEEGLEARWRRHADAGAYFQGELERRGLDILAPEPHRLPQLTALCVPQGVAGRDVQRRLLEEHGIEVGGALAGAPPIWRIGLMGVNATRDVAERLLQALDAVLAN
jgi:alanine-glyoxylate transaminase/serine-glyoxylate transaminase/serine-pyruvate transaminase